MAFQDGEVGACGVEAYIVVPPAARPRGGPPLVYGDDAL